MDGPPRFLTLTLWSALLLSLACVVALDTTEAQLAGVEKRGRRRGYGRSAKRALARDPTLACKVQKPTKGVNKGVWVPGAAQSKVLMTRILAQLRGKTTVKRQGNAVIKIRQLTLIRKFKGLSRPNSKQDPFLVSQSGIDYVAKSMTTTKEGCTMLKTLNALWLADKYNQPPGNGVKYSPVTKMLFVNLKLTKTLTPRACTTSEKLASKRKACKKSSKKNLLHLQSKCKPSCIRYNVAKKCEANKGRTQGKSQTLERLMLDSNDGFKTECAIL